MLVIKKLLNSVCKTNWMRVMKQGCRMGSMEPVPPPPPPTVFFAQKGKTCTHIKVENNNSSPTALKQWCLCSYVKHFLVLRYRDQFNGSSRPRTLYFSDTMSYLKSLCPLVSKGLLRPREKKACWSRFEGSCNINTRHLYFGFSCVPFPSPHLPSGRLYATDPNFRMKRALSMLNPGKKAIFWSI